MTERSEILERQARAMTTCFRCGEPFKLAEQIMLDPVTGFWRHPSKCGPNWNSPDPSQIDIEELIAETPEAES